MKHFFVFILAFILFMFPVSAQEDLLDLLEEMEEETTDYTTATFKSLRVINGHSIEIPAPGVLQFVISHRFGRVNGGAYEFFGLDDANMRMGFQYGMTPWLSLGVGRSSIAKTYDGLIKIKLLRQRTGVKSFPFTLTWVSGMAINGLRFTDPNRDNLFSSRMAFTHQLLIARKMSDGFSIQLSPSLVHRNLVANIEAENDVWSIGLAARQKLSGSLAINAEYYYLLPGYTADNFQSSLSIGIDLETGGHVFQIMLSNSGAMTENLFIANTTGKWSAGDIRIGFAINRVFTLKKQ